VHVLVKLLQIINENARNITHKKTSEHIRNGEREKRRERIKSKVK
jgi:hypothetical protein